MRIVALLIPAGMDCCHSTRQRNWIVANSIETDSRRKQETHKKIVVFYGVHKAYSNDDSRSCKFACGFCASD